MNTNKTIVEKVNYKGELRILGQIVADVTPKACENVLGYVVMIEKTQKVRAYTKEQTMNLLQRFKFVNAVLESGKIVNTECSMSRLPLFNRKLEVIKNRGVIILGEIFANNKQAGYRILSTNGKVVDITEKDLIRLIERENNDKSLLINAKLVTTNNKTIISAIKGEFTRIEKQEQERVNNTAKNNKADKSKRQAHIKNLHVKKFEKIAKESMIALILGNKPKIQELATVYNKPIRQYKANYPKFMEVAFNEVFIPERGYNIQNSERQVMNRIRATNFYSSKRKLALSVYQFILYNDDAYKSILSSIAQKVAYMPSKIEKYGTDIKMLKALRAELYKKVSYRSTIEPFVTTELGCNKLIDLIHDIKVKIIKPIDTDIQNRIDKLQNIKNRRLMEHEFTLEQFEKEEQFNQLGFTVVESKDKQLITTKFKFKKHLAYIGNYLDDYFLNNANLTKCLGDYLSVAYIQKLLNVYGDNYRDREGYAENYNMKKQDIRTTIQTIIIISFIFGSELMKNYLENDTVKLNMDLLDISIPDFEELSTTDYSLDPSIVLYYESGFNVYLNDNGNYSKPYLKYAKLINYRQLGISHKINHDILINNLAPTIALLAPEEFSAEAITEVIGSLRFL